MLNRFETFTVLISRINRNIRKIKNREMQDYNLKSHHISCLYYLYSCKEMTATDLCESCEEDKATVSRSLDYLEQNGFIRCECTSAKRYKSPLSLTEKGLEVGRQIKEKVDRVLNEVGKGLTEEERLSFYKYLTLISNTLDSVAK